MKRSKDNLTIPSLRPLKDQDRIASPKVTIFCPTYNHVNFIAECIEGILNQCVSFPAELIIHDDASDDGTREVIEGYRTNFPNVVKVVQQPVNLWPRTPKVLARVMEEFCRGKYVIICEGDDYWTDDYKLEKQVALLEQRPEYSACAHSYTVIGTTSGGEVVHNPNGTSEVALPDLLIHNSLSTSSVLVKRDNFRAVLPPELDGCLIGDWPRWVFAAANGPLYWIPEVMSVYRIHEASSWSSMMRLEQIVHVIRLFSKLYPFVENEYWSHLDKSVGRQVSHFLLLEYSASQLEDVLRTVRSCTHLDARNYRVGFDDGIIEFFTSFCPVKTPDEIREVESRVCRAVSQSPVGQEVGNVRKRLRRLNSRICVAAGNYFLPNQAGLSRSFYLTAMGYCLENWEAPLRYLTTHSAMGRRVLRYCAGIARGFKGKSL